VAGSGEEGLAAGGRAAAAGRGATAAGWGAVVRVEEGGLAGVMVVVVGREEGVGWEEVREGEERAVAGGAAEGLVAGVARAAAAARGVAED